MPNHQIDWTRRGVATDTTVRGIDWGSRVMPGATPLDQGDEPQGFFNYLGSLRRGVLALQHVRNAERRGMDPNEYAAYMREQHPNTSIADDMGRVINARQNTVASSAVLSDYRPDRIFGEIFSDIGAAGAAIASSPGAFWTELTTRPDRLAGTFALEMVRPFGDLVEARSGVLLSDSDIRPLTPGERADRTKNAAAFGVSLAVGFGVRGAMTRTVRAADRSLAAAVVTPTLTAGRDAVVATRAAARASTVASQLKLGFYESAAAGAAYGLVRFANEEEQLQEIIINGLIFAPIGMGLEFAGARGRRATGERNLRTAHDIFQARQLQFTHRSSILWGAKTAEAIMTSQSMVEAVVKARASAGTFTRLEGLEGKVDFTAIAPLLLDNGLESISRTNVNGTRDLMIYPTSMAKEFDHGMFMASGRVRGEVVSINGVTHVVQGYRDGLIVGESFAGRVSKVHPDRVRSSTEHFIGTSQRESALFTRQRIDQEARNFGVDHDETPTIKRNVSAVSNAETGKPVQVIGFRAERAVYDKRSNASYSILYNRAEKATHPDGMIIIGRDPLSKPQANLLTFENPLVINGRRGDLLKLITGKRNVESPDVDAAINATEGYLPESTVRLAESPFNDKDVFKLIRAYEKLSVKPERVLKHDRFQASLDPDYFLNGLLDDIDSGSNYQNVLEDLSYNDLEKLKSAIKSDLDISISSKADLRDLLVLVDEQIKERVNNPESNYTTKLSKPDKFKGPGEASTYLNDLIDSFDEWMADVDGAEELHRKQFKRIDELSSDDARLLVTQMNIISRSGPTTNERKLISNIHGKVDHLSKITSKDLMDAALKEFDTIANGLMSELGYDGLIYRAAVSDKVEVIDLSGKTRGDVKSPLNVVGVRSVSKDKFVQALYKGYRDSVLDKFSRRIDTQVLTLGGRPKVVFHGTHVAYDKMSLGTASSGLGGIGLYFTEAPFDIAGGYAIGYEWKAIVDMERELDTLYIKLNTELLDSNQKATLIDKIDVTERNIQREIKAFQSVNTGAANIRPAKLAIKNAFDLDRVYTKAEAIEIFNRMGMDGEDATTSYGGSNGEMTGWAMQDFYGKDNDRLQLAGYDGITHIGGKNTGSDPHKVWIAFREDQVLSAYEHDILDLPTPDGYNHVVEFKNFLNDHGVPESTHEALLRGFADDIEREVKAGMDPAEVKMLEKIQEQAHEEFAVTHADRSLDIKRLYNKANSNNMYIQVEDAGHISIKDIDTTTELYKASSIQDAADFIDKSGQANGINLDDDGGLPPSGGSQLLSGMDGDGKGPNLLGKNRFEKIRAAMNQIGSFLTTNRDLMVTYDDNFGNLGFLNKIFVPLQDARRLSNAKIHPWYEGLKEIESIVVDLSRADREIIGSFLETMTPDQVRDSYMSHRKMNDFEVSMGRKFADPEIDISKAFAFKRQIEALNEDLTKGKITAEQLTAMIQDARNTLGINDKTAEASTLLTEFSTMSKKEVSTGAVTRYARAMKNGEVDRLVFASKNKLTTRQLRAAALMETMYRKLSKEFGIEERQLLNGFMTHARLYTDGDLGTALKQHGGAPKAREFYSSMSRTGEIDAYEMDPIYALQKYIKAGFDAKYFEPALEGANKARIEIKKELEARFPKEAQKVMKDVDMYITDVRGMPGVNQGATQAAIDRLLRETNAPLHADVRKQVINVISQTFEAGAQGLRPVAGIRDFAMTWHAYGSKYGYDRAARMVTLGARGLDNLTKQDLIDMGEISQPSPIALEDVVELDTSRFKGRGVGKRTARGLNKFSNFAFKWSGQKDVYTLLHAGIYLDQFDRSGKALAKFREGKMNMVEVNEHLNLDEFERPVQEEFLRLVAEEKDEAATRYLAKQAIHENMVVYGMGNNPSGWQSNVGRVAGQFGMWPVWFKGFMGNITSRGTLRRRTMKSLRFAAGWYATGAIAEELGFDIRSWSPWGALTFGGGPLIGLAMDAKQAFFGHGYYQQQAQNRLKRWLPYDPFSDQFNIGQLYVPGSYFINDLVQAASLAERGFNPAAVGGRALGIKSFDDTRSPLDDWMGATPNITNGSNPTPEVGVLDPRQLFQ